ncbi:MAG: glycosyltransferase family 1 protein [Actinomycetota bacterium]|nr:glycosyltransferase family 1 protein [Actinomycetota bacterium]
MVRVLLDVSAVPAQPVGAGIYTIALASGLAAHPAVDLHLLARRADDRWSTVAPAATLHARAPELRPARLAWEQTSAARVTDKIRPDVYHGPHYTLPLRGTTRSVVTVHDLTFFDHPEWHERSKVIYFRHMIRAAAARADTVICVSEHTARRLRAVAPPTGDIEVIYHGVDHERFRPEATRADDLARLAGHGVSPPFIAFVGTIEPRKDVPIVVRAFARIAPMRPDLRLVLAGGNGWGTDAVRKAVVDSGVATRIIRTGYVPDDVVAALYRRAEVVAYPSLEEGFGLPALEALACGAALVTTSGSAVEEVVGDAAFVVPPGDLEAFGGAAMTLLDNTERNAELRAAGPERAARFTWDSTIERHVEVYERIAGRAAA